MVFVDPYTDAFLLAVTPPFIVLVYFAAFRRRELKRDLLFILSVLSLTTFYIIALDPSLEAALYTSQGNYSFPILVTAVASFFLLMSVVLALRSTRRGGNELF